MKIYSNCLNLFHCVVLNMHISYNNDIYLYVLNTHALVACEILVAYNNNYSWVRCSILARVCCYYVVLLVVALVYIHMCLSIHLFIYFGTQMYTLIVDLEKWDSWSFTFIGPFQITIQPFSKNRTRRWNTNKISCSERLFFSIK